MTTTAARPALTRAAPRHAGMLADGWRRFRRRRVAVAALAVLGALVLVAALADVLAPYGVAEQLLAPAGGDAADAMTARATGKFEPPSWQHLFGTDHLARDIFSRTLVGLRISLALAAFAVVVVGLLGVLLGALAAMGPRAADDALMRLTDLAYAFPDLLLIVLLSSAFGSSFFGVRELYGVEARVLLLFLAISLTAWPTTARLVRGQLLALRGREFVLAAEALGASPARRVLHHMLPNALGPVLVDLMFLAPRVIIAEAVLSFIGIGLSPPAPSLGLLISDHFAFVGVQWTALAIPIAVLVTVFLAFQVVGDGLRDALDPRTPR